MKTLREPRGRGVLLRKLSPIGLELASAECCPFNKPLRHRNNRKAGDVKCAVIVTCA